MKKAILISLALLLALSLPAQEQRPHFSPEEFRNKQQEYITRQACLTPQEAEKFFPIFFELQDKRWEINHNAWMKVPRSRDTEQSEEQMELLAKGLAEAKIEIALIEKQYLEKYHTVLSYKKILDVQRAEEGFQRDLLRRMVDGRNKRKQALHGNGNGNGKAKPSPHCTE